MTRSDRLRWVSAGSPFRLMTPARDLRDVLRRHGYTVYDIGNQAHLEHEPPEDHTPYSETGYPGRATYGVGYAVDIMPPAAGARSKVDGLPLPSLQQLGARLLADRKAGVAGIRWLKYMNWEPERNNGGPCYQDSWRPTYARRSSTDRGHIHLSALTGYDSSTIGAGYDPVTRIRGGHDDMSFFDEKQIEGRTGAQLVKDVWWLLVKGNPTSALHQSLAQLGANLNAADFDEAKVIAGVLAGLTPEKIADAIPPTVAKQVADILAARLAS